MGTWNWVMISPEMGVKTIHDYAGLVRRVERLASAHPTGYRLRLAGLTALGFAAPLGALLLAVAVAASFVALATFTKSLAAIKLLQLAWIPLGLAVVIVRALAVRIPPPQGRRVDAVQAPALFEAIERVRRVGDSKPVHEVLLIDELNAAVMERPAWGLVGPTRRSLLLGVPLMAALTPGEFDAVLAHEFGHLARKHARFGNWIYRLRQSWARMLHRLEADEHLAVRGFRAFYRWFSPYYSAYSYVLAQANEYQADDNAARASGPRAAGDALIRLAVLSSGSSAYWQRTFRLAESQPDPPGDAIARYYELLGGAVNPEFVRLTLQRALDRETGLDDTHPSLKDRLRHLDVEPRPPDPPVDSAATAYLGELFQDFKAREASDWLQKIDEAWKQRFAESAGLRPRLAELQQRDAEGSLADDEVYELGTLIERFEGAPAALPLYERAVDRGETRIAASFACGRIRLGAGAPDGVTRLEALVDPQTEATLPAANLLYQYFLARNETEKAARYELILRAAAERDADLQRARETVTKKDLLERPRLSENTLRLLRETIAGIRRLKAARIAFKGVAGHPDEYVLVMCLKFRELTTRAAEKQVAFRLLLDTLTHETLPAGTSVVLFDAKSAKWLWRRLGKVANSRLHG